MKGDGRCKRPAHATPSQEDDMPPHLPSLPPGLCICNERDQRLAEIELAKKEAA
jgi:hypothetical protein